MKRIYATLAILGGFISGASAQVIDLASEVAIVDGTSICLGQTFTGDTTVTDQPYGVWGIINNGPESLVGGDQLMFIYPPSVLTETGIGVWVATVADDASVAAGEVAFAETGLMVDSIKTLLNIEEFEGGGTTFTDIMVKREDLINGETYGFYFYVIGIGSDPNEPENTDTVSNNFNYVPVIWNDCASSLKDLIAGKDKIELNAYPNPATSTVNFDYVFAKASTVATVKVADLTGRTVISKDFGKVLPGKETFNLDISSLVPGTYLIEFSTENERGVTKFTVSK